MPSPPKIAPVAKVLVIDDEPRYRVMIQVRLEADGHRVIAARGARDGWEKLVEEQPLVVLCAHALPEATGIEFIRQKQLQPEVAGIPVILMTEAFERDARELAISTGAADTLIKPFELSTLTARVKLAAAARSAALELERLAARDPLTGLLNRRAFSQAWEAEKARARRYGHPLSVIAIDIDHFKKVNDTYGHETGDKALQALAKLLLDSLRQTDLAARFGGEEFIVALPHVDCQGAMVVAERIRTAFSTVVFDENAPSSTLSAGVCGTDREPNSEELLRRSDDALYNAKRSGRNRVVLWGRG